MRNFLLKSFCFICLFFLLPAGCNGSSSDSGDGTHSYRVDEVLSGLEHPWGMVFLPGDNNMALVTERPGRLNLVNLDSGERFEITGLPQIAASGQGGLLDVALHPDFQDNNLVYFTYSAVSGETGQYATHVSRARLDITGERLSDVELLLVAEPFADSNAHFGSRLVFDNRQLLYVSSGDRRNRDSAQDLSSLHGKTLRINDDGTIPDDNPFVNTEGAHPAIFSYGHRNAQGMAVHPETGEIWQNEHGERAGDEINILVKGGNFGWPIATYGREYSDGTPIGVLPPEHETTIDPVHYWENGAFPPSGMAFYQGEAFSAWQGDLLVGGLREGYIIRFEVTGNEVIETERLLEDRGWRIRDVRVNPADGLIYVLVDASSAPIVRISPDEE
jgi:aldose sugar dehydrogenase